jgi:hypothetical protein
MINAMALDKGFTEVVVVGDFNHPSITWSPAPTVTHVKTDL